MFKPDFCVQNNHTEGKKDMHKLKPELLHQILSYYQWKPTKPTDITTVSDLKLHEAYVLSK